MAQISKSGFNSSNSIFYSKRKPIALPSNSSLDLTTFISSRAHNGKIAYIDASTGDHLTFPQVWQAVDSLSTSLSDLGIRKGHVVLLLSPNSIYFPIICLSVMSLGAIITTTNPLNTTHEIGKQIADSKPVLAFTTHSLLPKLTPTNLPIVLIDTDSNSRTPKNAKIVSTLTQMLKKQPSQVRVRDRVNQDDTASLLYSSGTTGASKGVVSSHRNLIGMVQTILNRFRLEDGEQTFICTVPMFHIYGLAAFASGLLASGSTIIVLSRFEMDEMFSSIEKYRATYLPLVPPILIGMINSAEVIKKKYDLSSLASVLSGGAPLSKEVTEGFLEKYPTVKILQGYGLTETAGIGASTDDLEESRRYGTAGLLSPSMEARIVDPDSGESLVVNRTGELWLRGPTVMKEFSVKRRTDRGEIERFARLTRAEKQAKLPEVAHFFEEKGGAAIREKRKVQKERALSRTKRGVMEKRTSDLITREERQRVQGSARRVVRGESSGAGGSGNRPEWGSMEAPVELEPVVLTARARGRSERRPRDVSEQDAGRAAKVARHARGDGASTGGGSDGGAAGATVSRRSGARPEQVMDLATFGMGSGAPRLGRDPSPVKKAKAPRKATGKAVASSDDLEGHFVYLDENGAQRTVKRSDCCFRSSKIAGCLLEQIALDGNRRELDEKGLADNLKRMEIAQCVLVSGFQKLKEIAQFAESDREMVLKLGEELKNVQDASQMEREELEDLKKAHEALTLAKLLKDTEAEELRQKLGGAEDNVRAAAVEIGRLNEYALHCKKVAQDANQAYDTLDADFVELETDYNALKEEHARCASRPSVEEVPGDAGGAIASSVSVPEAGVARAEAVAPDAVMSLELDGIAIIVDGREAEVDEAFERGGVVNVAGDEEL